MEMVEASSSKWRAINEECQRLITSGDTRMKSALTRCGFEPDVSLRNLMAAWRSLGFSIEDFGASHPVDLIEVLEAKARVLERIQARGRRGLSESLRRNTGIFGGRPKEPTTLDGEAIRAARGDKPRATFAHLCGISVDTLDRAERGERIAKTTLRKMLKVLNTQRKNRPQKPQ
jgi:hypothetical protein